MATEALAELKRSGRVRVEDPRVNQVFPRLDCLAAVQALLRDRFEAGN